MSVISSLINIPSTDPDSQRRSRLLIVLLLGAGGLTTLAVLATTLVWVTGLESLDRISALLRTSLVTLAGLIIILIINRYWSGLLASSLFVLLLTAGMAFTDEPYQVANGRSLFLFAVPILMASVLLRPWASFIIAGLSSGLIAAIAVSIDIVPNAFAMLGFFALALVSWLASRSLEQALAELRAINRELDQRVEERTRDLAAALAREQAEASKSQAILEGIADGVIVFDDKSKAIVANPAMSQLIERPTNRILGHPIEALMGRDVAPKDQERIAHFLRDGETEIPSLRVEWGAKTLSVSVAPVRAAPDRVTGTVAVFRDFTREAEVERLKSTFVSMVSHDLRTPLSAIVGYIDMLRERVYGPLSERQMTVMQRINANTQRLLSLVNNLLDQAQIEAGRLRLHIAPFSPGDLVQDLESVMSILAQNKGLKLDCEIADDVPAELSGDRQRLHQILVNLVSNAIKFTEQGRVGVRLYRSGTDQWALEVSDTGPGIPPEAQESIFDPFGRAGDPITREHAGVGLGLAIVTHLTVMMGGEINLESELGRGSTFTVVLPLTPAQEE